VEGISMFKTILVAIDGSQGAWRALRAAVELGRILGARLTALAVEEHLPRYAATVGEMEEAKADANKYFARVLAEASELARGQGVPLETAVRPGHAAETILRFAEEGHFDLIVMGSKGHSFVRDFFLGSTTDRVSHHASCAVLIVR